MRVCDAIACRAARLATAGIAGVLMKQGRLDGGDGRREGSGGGRRGAV